MKMKKILALAMAAVLLVAVTVAGTVAYLQASTQAVTNTFTTADIGIDLYETKDPSDATKDKTYPEKYTGWTAQMIPDVEYRKNPTVKVDADTDLPIYVFVKFNPGTTKNYLDYEMDWEKDNTAGWTKLDTTEHVAEGDQVYYLYWNPERADSQWSLIVDEKVTVKSNLVENGDTIANGVQMPTSKATMTFTAYAIQQAGFTPEQAWNQVNTEAYAAN